MTPAVIAQHLTLDSTGIARISGITLKARELGLEHGAHGRNPEEIHF